MKRRAVALLLAGVLAVSMTPGSIRAEEMAPVEAAGAAEELQIEEEVQATEEVATEAEEVPATVTPEAEETPAKEVFVEEEVDDVKPALKLGGNDFTTLPSGYITDEHEKMSWGIEEAKNFAIPDNMKSEHILNVLGKIGDKWYKTTYGNYGFSAIVQVLEDGAVVYGHSIDPSMGEYQFHEDVYTSYSAKLINGGSYVQLNTTVQNRGTESVVVNIGGNSDIQIAADDYAPMEVIEGGAGIRMWSQENANQQFNFYCSQVNGTTDVDTFWMGFYNSAYNHMLEQTDLTSLSGVDSGISYSWQNRTIQPGEKKTYSVLVGLGKINKAPVITENKKLFNAAGNQAAQFAACDEGQMRVKVKDVDNTFEELQMYRALDNGEFEAVDAVFDEEGNFAVDFQVPADFAAGTHTVKLYVQDPEGGISAVAAADFTVPAEEEIVMYTVTFVDADGNEIAVVEVEEQAGATAPEAPVKEGYDFTGWDKDFSKVTENMTVTAQYVIKTFTVTFMTDANTVIGEVQTVPYMSAATAPKAPAKEGYYFEKWDKSFDKVTDNLVVTAVYQKIETPKTGDEAQPLPYAVLAFGALLLGFTAVKKRRTEEN